MLPFIFPYFRLRVFNVTFCFTADELFSDRKNLAVCLHWKWPGILWMGFVSEISWHVMFVGSQSIVENGNTRGKQTMLYFQHVAIFISIWIVNFTETKAYVTLLACCYCVLYNIFVKTMSFLSKWICPCNPVQVRIFEKNNFWNQNFYQNEFYIFFCEWIFI